MDTVRVAAAIIQLLTAAFALMIALGVMPPTEELIAALVSLNAAVGGLDRARHTAGDTNHLH